jgi:phosphate starvation-inducible protein PhoH and related proteins
LFNRTFFAQKRLKVAFLQQQKHCKIDIINTINLNNLSEIILNFDDLDLVQLYGENNIKLNLLRKAFPEVTLTSRGNTLRILGEKKDAQLCKARIESMVRMLRQTNELTVHAVQDILEGSNPFEVKLNQSSSENIILYGRDGAPIKAKTRNQKRLVETCEQNDIVFAIGPAGTGKTYTAVALAVRALKNKSIKRIILTRPAVEAGENLGFLPGDLKEKIDPYLRPLYDALDDMLPSDKLAFFMQNRTIEIAPMAFMRGRTLDNAFVILDEAQNATTAQLKMFLTRLGPSAKAVVTGDLTQIDLPQHQKSGLGKTLRILDNIDGIGILHLANEDIVRHRLVKAIVTAYDKLDEDEKQARFEREERAEALKQQKQS